MRTAPTIVVIDLGKNWFHRVGLDGQGATVLRKKLNRRQLAEYAATAAMRGGDRVVSRLAVLGARRSS